MRLIPPALLSLAALGACETVPGETPAGAAAPAAIALDETTGAGVYFPPPTSTERADIRFAAMAGVGPQQRQGFVDQVNLAASNPARPVPIVAQSVGADRQTLVLMHLGAEGPTTPYMARAILARLTSILRFAPAVTEMGLSSEFDVYNMAAVLGFQRIIVTDGRSFAHDVSLKPE